jgi:threonine dehydratase
LASAQAGLAGVAERTPLVSVDGFEHPVRLKAEYLQPIKAFKIRGAWTAVSRLAPELHAKGVVTSSSGNHGYGLAWAAKRLGMPATVVMPESTPRVKQDNIRSVEGRIVLEGATRGPEQYAAAERIAREEGSTLIPPFDHPDVIAGQATCALEILEDWPDVATIVVPTGGGGLLAGTCLAIKASARPVHLVGVEPEQIPKLSAAIRAGSPIELPAGTSLADGMLTRSIGTLTWPIIAPMINEAISVTDDEIRAALRWLGGRGIVVEPSAATPVAALLCGKLTLRGPTALIVSGGNIDPERYNKLVQ